LREPEALWFVAPQRGLCRSDARRQKTVSRAVGAVVASPALQRFQLPTSCAPSITPSWMSTRRVKPLQIVSFPGGESALARQIAAQSRQLNQIMREQVLPQLGSGLVGDQSIQNAQLQIREDQFRVGVGINAIGHGEPEDAPAQKCRTPPADSPAAERSLVGLVRPGSPI